MRDIAPSCQEVAHLQSRGLDQALPLRAWVGIKCHLIYCVWCRRYHRQIRFLREALRREGEHLAVGTIHKLPPEKSRQIKEFLWNEIG